jgi:hypothetical protein
MKTDVNVRVEYLKKKQKTKQDPDRRLRTTDLRMSRIHNTDWCGIHLTKPLAKNHISFYLFKNNYRI